MAPSTWPVGCSSLGGCSTPGLPAGTLASDYDKLEQEPFLDFEAGPPFPARLHSLSTDEGTGVDSLPDFEDPPELREVPAAAQAKQRRPAARARRTCRCYICLVPLGLAAFQLLAVGLLGLSSLSMEMPSQCALEDHDVTDALDHAMVVGNRTNMIGERWSADSLDLTGLWWFRWVRSASVIGSMRMEVLVTFAGSKMVLAGAHKSFPGVLQVPGAQPRHWGYSDSWVSTVLMMLHSFSWDPEAPLDFHFTGPKYAGVDHIGDLIRLNSDEWFRPNNFDYVLTRVAFANGTRHPTWWPKLEHLMRGYKLRTWTGTDVCRRRCETTGMALATPRGVSCKWCSRACGGGGGTAA